MATDTDTLLAEAARLGAAAGQMAGTWCYDGNTLRQWYTDMLRMDEDGDPAFWDDLPCGPLSGEWADGYTPDMLMRDLIGDIWRHDGSVVADMLYGDICTAYEDAWRDALRDEILRVCHYQLSES